MNQPHGAKAGSRIIRTPDQRLRVFVSSTLQELAAERDAAREAIESLRMSPVLFELGARPHPAQELYRAYLAQSHIFIGIYWQRYGWVAPDMAISGLEDEFRLAKELPKLIYIKSPAPDREAELAELLRDIKRESGVSYKYFSTTAELRELVADDLALMLTERFEQSDRHTVFASRSELAAPDSPHGHLPALPTPLVGRDAQLAKLRDLISGRASRLITITGPGGVGKTSLALKVAADAAPTFADGVYWVPLATVQDADLVLSTVAQALGVRERAGTALLESVGQYLQQREALLVLDNLEHLLQAASLVVELLAAASELVVLATSRAPLQVRGEQVFTLQPLELPPPGSERSPERARRYAAVALFEDRARAVAPSFALDKDNVGAVAELARQVDGLPLAIELAAARLRLFTPREMVARMSSSLDLLTAGAQDLPSRQRTLRQAIAWSYDLLEEDAKQLFRRLGVFAGGFTMRAAEQVCRDVPGGSLLDGVQLLLDNSLLRRETTPGHETRYVMLQTIREFALERLEDAGENDDTRERHAGAFAAFVRDAWDGMFSGASELWLDRIEADYNNIRSALAWHAEDSGVSTRGCEMIAFMVWFWYRRGYLDEARRWYERALASVKDREADALKGLLLGHAGSVAMWQSDLHTAGALMDEGIAILRRTDETWALGDVLFTRGVLAVNQGQDEKATEVLEEALALMQALGRDWFVAMIVLHLGNVALNQGRVAHAKKRMDEALTIGRRVGDDWIVASAINNFGEIARYEQRLEEAERYYLESMALFRSVGSTPDMARGLNSLAFIAIARGDYENARRYELRSRKLYQQVGVKRGVAECVIVRAALAAAEGLDDAAKKMAGEARAAFSALGAGVWPADRQDLARLMNV